MELIGTFILTTTVLYAKYTPNIKTDQVHRLALLIGISYALVTKMGLPISGACFSPAISASLFMLDPQKADSASGERSAFE
jgi:glycerol uptake facilitator-like aquaporin